MKHYNNIVVSQHSRCLRSKILMFLRRF